MTHDPTNEPDLIPAFKVDEPVQTEDELWEQIISYKLAVQAGSKGREFCFNDEGIDAIVQLFNSRLEAERLDELLSADDEYRLHGADGYQRYLNRRIDELRAAQSAEPKQAAEEEKTVTKQQLKENEVVGWYDKPDGSVYQVMTRSPYTERYVGKLV